MAASTPKSTRSELGVPKLHGRNWHGHGLFLRARGRLCPSGRSEPLPPGASRVECQIGRHRRVLTGGSSAVPTGSS
eukprot:12767070-Alexandrium_andersonii.AAC.1